MNISKNYQRDLIGYASKPPYANWPKHAFIAIQFVLNYEEGAESHIFNGDQYSEKFLSDLIDPDIYPNRHMSIDSLYEYGSRVGFWRIHNEFQLRKLPLTIFGVSLALAKNLEIVQAIKQANYDVVNHGWRWINYQNIDIKTERKHMQKSIALYYDLFGKFPTGWYTGRDSPNTRNLLVEQGGFTYDSDYYGDDLPFWINIQRYDGTLKQHLIIPYTLECNDMRFALPQGFNTAEHFFVYLKDTFNILYEEGKIAPKMMSIGMHCRLLGRPGKFYALKKFLDYIQNYENIWICTRQQIADHWLENHLN
ncbi:allantoinase PuuE [Candidatus Pantoea edessiphila]|uniref:Allantoinase PuuE n=1 Tax=Candidatus Pantoea edessiphila TaxID=2044610 RepID=A0A2P5SXH4_9GAMM|nr:allantoinase PuuE [Candidatus Pantoea edessiphila]MBK4775818.1 allantoinase PuuE [Pantoea sp. Edef]PPI87000.1 allantoinase PuuE [Candidatus Pantoea edessiphila]